MCNLWATWAVALRGLKGPVNYLVHCTSGTFMFTNFQTSDIWGICHPVQQSKTPVLSSLSYLTKSSSRSTSMLSLAGWPWIDPSKSTQQIQAEAVPVPRALSSSDKISTHPAMHPNAWGHSEAEQTPLMKWYNFSKVMRRRRWPESTGMNPNGQQVKKISSHFPHKLTEVMLARIWIFLASSSLQLYTWLGLICYLCQLCIFVKFKGLLPWPDLAKSELTCGSLVAISF